VDICGSVEDKRPAKESITVDCRRFTAVAIRSCPRHKRGSRQDLQLAKMLSTDGSGHGTYACESSSNMWLKHNLHKCSCSSNTCIERISFVAGIDFDRSIHPSFLQLASSAAGKHSWSEMGQCARPNQSFCDIVTKSTSYWRM